MNLEEIKKEISRADKSLKSAGVLKEHLKKEIDM